MSRDISSARPSKHLHISVWLFDLLFDAGPEATALAILVPAAYAINNTLSAFGSGVFDRLSSEDDVAFCSYQRPYAVFRTRARKFLAEAGKTLNRARMIIGR